MLVGRSPGHIGEQDAARWRRIGATYRKLGLLSDDTLPEALIWHGNDGPLWRWLTPLLLVPVGLAIAALVAYRSRRTLRGALSRVGAPPLVATMGRPKLSLIISVLFNCL